MPSLRGNEFVHTRGYARKVLSDLLQIPPLDIPLEAPIGETPTLSENLGYLSWSHCKDALIVGWSLDELGVDLERTDRQFESEKLAKRFFSEEEKKSFKSLSKEAFRKAVLKTWVLKEASIKCHNGTIAMDFSKWIINNNYDKSYNNSLDSELITFYFEYKFWSIGIAFKSKNYKYYPILCKI